MARAIDAYAAIDMIDEWLDSVGTVMVGKGLSSYGELIGCIEDTPTITPPNEPLTLDELREMDGEPVWVDFSGSSIEREPGWFILKNTDGEEVYLVGKVSVYKAFEYYGTAWLAYAYHPSRIDRKAWEPCEICGKMNDEIMCKCSKYTSYDKSITTRYTSAKFCPVCGRPLTEDAWAELEKRLMGCKMSEWISVKDRLPEDEKSVLAYYGFYWDDDLGARFIGALTYFCFDPKPHWQHESTGLFVTHWMPLPEPPKED